MSPAATGFVCIVNTTNQLVTLILNHNALSELGPAGGEAEHYAPSYISVARSNANRILDPVFAEENSFDVMFYGVRNSYQIKIELERFPSNNDLLLHIFYKYIVVTDRVTNATVLNTAVLLPVF